MGVLLRRSSPSSEEVRNQLELILGSRSFRGATGQQDFLKFVTLKAIEGREEEIKESTIATDVFHRRSDFDGRIDTVVRVQAHRLRGRLKGYYAGDGADDAILIEIPKGHYIPRFSRRDPAAHAEGPDAGDPRSGEERDPPEQSSYERRERGTDPTREGGRRRSRAILVLALLLAGAAIGFVLAHLVGVESQSARVASPEAKSDSSLNALWGTLLTDSSPTVLAFTNAVFLMSPDGDYYRYTGHSSGPTGAKVSITPEIRPHLSASALSADSLFYNTNMTAVGEVQSVHLLTRLFESSGAHIEVKSSRLLWLDDFKVRNVLFLGSPYGNKDLSELCGNQPFSFGDGEIVNHQPLPGEPSSFAPVVDEQSGVRLFDYALISVLPSLNPAKKIVVLAGLWTEGTLGATQFVTNANSMDRLVNAFGGTLPEHFQAVVKTEILKDQASRTTLVARRSVLPTSLSPSGND